jgi:hypothetical protein
MGVPVAAPAAAVLPNMWFAAGWTVVVVGGPTSSAELRLLCACAPRLLRPGGLVACDLSGLHTPDLAAVDALGRLRLSARRIGARLQIGPVSAELAGLLGWIGLGETLDDPHR